jgi:soluble lytic murein transglycosylase
MFSAGRYIYKTKYIDFINTECAKYEINPTEILSIIKAESNFNPDAVSSKNAIGLMQITLETANWCCEIMNMDYVTKSDLCVPETNIKIGVYYYNYLLDRYNNINTALAAYNAGEGRISDCRNLAAAKGLDNSKWDEIVKVIPMMREESILEEESVKLGKFKGYETIDYVESILSHYKAICEITSL